MEETNEISVELSALSELVSGISRQIPYGVPAGYFEHFPALMMSRVAARSTTFKVPEGYFEGLAAQVLSRIRSGGQIERSKVNEEELPPIFSQISRVSPYQVPEGYFEELHPFLMIAHDRSTYQVPEGYFAELPVMILEKVAKPASELKVIPMERRDTGRVLKGNWWKYSSVAAIAACLLLIFSWPQVDNKATGTDKPGGVETALQKVSDQEMQAYLDDQRSILAEVANPSTATLDMNEGEVKSLLGEVSDNDLQQFMEEHGKADDLATN